MFSGCVSHLVSPAQSSVHKVAVLGFGEEQDEEKVFVALPEKGMFEFFFTSCLISLKIMGNNTCPGTWCQSNSKNYILNGVIMPQYCSNQWISL